MPQNSSIPKAIEALKHGRFVIVLDDEERENEGDLVLAARHATEKKMAFMIRHTGGVVCLPLSEDRADRLGLPPMVETNTSRFATPFTVSIDAAEGTTTGISAHDRALTARTAADPHSRATAFRRPGHLFPLRTREGGVLVRAGHSEAAVDLCRLANVQPVGILSELMHEDGTMMRLPSLRRFGARHRIPLLSIADLIAWRRKRECLVQCTAESPLETDTGLWTIKVYTDSQHHQDHVALVKGTILPRRHALVRVHSECLSGDALGSMHCDCGMQLRLAMRRIAEEGAGVLVYLRQEGRGIGLSNKIRAYALQQTRRLDTAEANQQLGFPVDLREYGIGAEILREIGVGKMRLLTNNPKKIVGLERYGLSIVEQVPLEIRPASKRQRHYLRTKKNKMGHLLKKI